MHPRIGRFVTGTPEANLLNFSIAAYFVICCAVTFLYQTALDNYLPVGQSTVIRIDALAPNVTKAEAADALIRIAEDARRNIYKVTPDPENPDKGRILFGFIGDPTASIERLADGGYPSFDPSRTTDLRSWTRLEPQDMRGMYVSNFSPAEGRDLVIRLGSVGLEATLGPPLDGLAMASILFGPPRLGPAVLVALAGLLVSTAFYSAKRFRVIAVREAHGDPFAGALLRETGFCLRAFVIIYGSLLAVAVALLFLYNGLNQGGPVIATVLGLSLIGLVPAVTVLVALCLACRRWPLAETVKGRAPLKFLLSAAAVAQIVGLAVVFPSVSALAATIERIQHDSRLDDQWIEARDLVTTRFGGTNTPADFMAAAPLMGGIARAEDRAGRLIIAWPFQLASNDSLETARATDLVVNAQYLDRQVVLDQTGDRIPGPRSSDQLLLLIPESQKEQKEQLESRAVQWLELQRNVQKRTGAIPQIVPVLMQSGQQLFNYHSSSAVQGSAQLDPVVLVMPADSTALSDDFFVSAASSGGLLFSDRTHLESLARTSGIDKYLMSVDSVSELALEERAQRLSELRMKTGELALMVAVVVTLISVVSAAYCERDRRRLFLERIHGRSFVSRHLRFLIAAAGGALAVLGGCIVLRTAGSGAGLMANTGVIAVLISVAAAVLASQERRATARVPE